MTPVIVGAGQCTHRDDDDLAGAEPVALIEAAARAAGDDAASGRGADLLRRVDVVELMGVGSWWYDDLPGLVARRLGADVPAGRRRMLPTGGETPLRALDLAAARIADGDAKVVLLAGAEATRAATRAKRAGVELPWTTATRPRPPWTLGPELAGAQALGIERAVDVFPMYEHGLRAVEGRSLEEAQRESAELWAGLSRVAATNPYAWSRDVHDADTLEKVTPDNRMPDNRMVAWPYPKRLVANPFVNQGAALLLTDTETARAHGIPEDRWVYPWGGAGADEPTDPRARDHYGHNRALEAAVQVTQAITRTSLADYDAIELYSCFPAMPKLTARVLGLDTASPSLAPARSVPISVTGGLSFAGGPGSNYLTHSLAQMVGRLRESGGTGFVHGVGMFNTKHHCLVLSARPSPRGEYPQVPHDPAEARPPLYDPVPVDEGYEGPLTIETLSVRFGRDGAPTQGVVLGRGSEGQRAGARVVDADTLAGLTGDGEPVGRRGRVIGAAAGRAPARFTL